MSLPFTEFVLYFSTALDPVEIEIMDLVGTPPGNTAINNVLASSPSRRTILGRFYMLFRGPGTIKSLSFTSVALMTPP